MVEPHVHVIPAPRLEGRDNPPAVAVAEGKLSLRGREIDRRRLDHTAADVEPAGTGRLVCSGRGDRAEIETDMERRACDGREPVVERVAHPFVRLPRADADAARPLRMHMPPRALRLGQHGIRPRREPRLRIRPFADLLGLEIEIDAPGERSPLEGRLLPRPLSKLPIERRKRLGLFPVEPRCFLRGHQAWEVGGALVLLAPGKGPGGALEDAVEGVVVGGAHRIVFVVVAAGTAEREAEDRAAEGVDAVGEIEMLEIGVGGVAVALADGEEAGGGNEIGVGAWLSLAGEDVAGDLPGEKLVVGHVGIEGPDHPVAIAAGFADGVVGAVAGGIGIAGDVEPVAPPALSVGGRCEEPVDDPLPGIGRGVVEEGADLRGRRREAGEIEGDAAEERAPIGERRRFQPSSFEPCDDEAIDVIGHELRIGDGRRPHCHRPGKAPPRSGGFPRHAAKAGFKDARIGSTGADPGGEVVDLAGGQCWPGILRRHRRDPVGMLDGAEEEARVNVAGDDRRPGVAAAGPALPGIERQATAGLAGCGRMAALAAGDQERPDAAFEEIVVGRRRRRRGAKDHR